MFKKITKTALLAAATIAGLNASAQSGTVYITANNGIGLCQLYRVSNVGTPAISSTAIGGAAYSYYSLGYCSNDAKLYAIDNNSKTLIRIDTASGIATPMGVTLPAGNSYDAGTVVNNTMYVTNLNGGSNRQLYRINLSNSTYDNVTIGIGVSDIAYYDGYLYGYNGAAPGIYRIDPATGANSMVGPASSLGAGGVVSVWSDGTGMIYFDKRGTYNVNTGVVTVDNTVGTGSGSGIPGAQDGDWSPMNSNTDLTNGGIIAANQTGCGTFDPAALTAVTAPSGGNGTGAIIYKWWANGSVIPGATSATYDPGPITTTTNYQRQAQRTGTTAWVTSNTVTMTVNAAPTASIGVTGASGENENCHTGAVTLTASGASSYSWSNGATTASITVNPALTTIYTVTASNTGCSSTATASKAVQPAIAPVVSVTAGATAGNPACAGSPVTLTATGGDSYAWSDGVTGPTRTVTAGTANQTYTVTASKVGCTITGSSTVTVYSHTCGTDLAVSTDMTGSSLLSAGGSTSFNVIVENILPTATPGIYTFTISKPSGPSGLSVIIGSSPLWTVTPTANQFTVTSTSALAGNSSITVPVTVNRTGGGAGAFTFTATITGTDDTNTSNNNASVTIKKL